METIVINIRLIIKSLWDLANTMLIWAGKQSSWEWVLGVGDCEASGQFIGCFFTKKGRVRHPKYFSTTQ